MPETKPKPKPKPQEDPVAAARAYLNGLEARGASPPPLQSPQSYSTSDPAAASGADIPMVGGSPPVGTEALQQALTLAARNQGVAARANPNAGGPTILDALLGVFGK